MPIQQFVDEDLSETVSEETVMVRRKADFSPMWHAAPHRTAARLPQRGHPHLQDVILIQKFLFDGRLTGVPCEYFMPLY